MSDQNWHYLDANDEQQGPVTPENLVTLVQAGTITPQTQVWTEGLEQWLPAEQIEGLFPPTQPETPVQPQTTPTGPLIPNTPTTQPVQGTPVGAPSPDPYASPQTSPHQTGNIYPPTITKGGSVGTVVTYFAIGMLCILLTAPIASAFDLSGFGAVAIAIATPVIGIVCLAIAAIYQYIYLYRAWACLQPGGATITPGKAVGFLFIPLFNIYWMFIAFGSLPRQWNEITSSYENTKHAPKLSMGAFICLLLIPGIGLIIWLSEICKGLNFMARIGQSPSAGTGGGGGLNFGPTLFKDAPTLTHPAPGQPTNPDAPGKPMGSPSGEIRR